MNFESVVEIVKEITKENPKLATLLAGFCAFAYCVYFIEEHKQQ